MHIFMLNEYGAFAQIGIQTVECRHITRRCALRIYMVKVQHNQIVV